MYANRFVVKGRVPSSGSYRVFVVATNVPKAHVAAVVERARQRIPRVECWRVPMRPDVAPESK